MSIKVTHNGKHWSNAKEDRIVLVKYDCEWPKLFKIEQDHLLSVLPSGVSYRIEHFGSTAIPGMTAKPIIDILIICDSQFHWKSFIKPIESLGYVYWEQNPRKDRMFFVKGMPPFGERRTHHLHVRLAEDTRSALLFRDYLKLHPKEAQTYTTLKYELMNLYENDREDYTNAKKEYVEKVVLKAKKCI